MIRQKARVRRLAATSRNPAAIAVSMLAALAAFVGASHSASAAYPGAANGRLAFGMSIGGNVDIYSTRPNGHGLRQLTSNPAFDACPAYSPDGKHIAYCSNRSGAFEIWQMDQNGKRQRPVTKLGGFATFPDYSPDGNPHRVRRSGRQ